MIFKIPMYRLLLVDICCKESECKWKLLSRVWLFVALPLWPHGLYGPWNSPGQNTGVGSCSLPPSPGIKPRSPALQADSLPAEPPGKPRASFINFLVKKSLDLSCYSLIYIIMDYLMNFYFILWIICIITYLIFKLSQIWLWEPLQGGSCVLLTCPQFF